jgi:hypothetical protein
VWNNDEDMGSLMVYVLNKPETDGSSSNKPSFCILVIVVERPQASLELQWV